MHLNRQNCLRRHDPTQPGEFPRVVLYRVQGNKMLSVSQSKYLKII